MPPAATRSLVTQSRRHPLADRGHDLYETDPAVTHALLKAELLPTDIWECAAGRGAIVRELRAHGHRVYASDIADYGTGDSGIFDFLTTQSAPFGIKCIVTNPPYKVAPAFVRHALKLCPRVIMLLRLAFLESVGRSDILEGGKLARVFIFRNRLPFMHRVGWIGPRATSAIPFMWAVWDASHRGPPGLHRISWERE
jgi:hypothetical protein